MVRICDKRAAANSYHPALARSGLAAFLRHYRRTDRAECNPVRCYDAAHGVVARPLNCIAPLAPNIVMTTMSR